MRTVLVHCHLFKNAGTTLDWSLRTCFGDRFVEHTDDEKMRTGPAYLSDYLTQHESLCALSSHHVHFPMPELDGTRILPLVMLRHPIDRVGSVYNFEARQKSNGAGAVNAKKMIFPEYVMWRMSPSSGATIRNFQTRRLCDHFVRTGTSVAEEDFVAALRQVQHLQLMGIVERYDESMVLFEETLRPFFPNIDLAYVRQNVSRGRKKTVEARVEAVYARLGSEISTLLKKKNQWDQALYEVGQALLLKRIEAVPAFEEKLAAFRKRCQDLVNGPEQLAAVA